MKFFLPVLLSILVGFAQAAERPVADSSSEVSTYLLADLGEVIRGNAAARIELGMTADGRRVDAWYFPGQSDQRALVIGGVHGSELSSVEVAVGLIEMLKQSPRPFYSVIIIPCLFPDNAAMAMSRPGQVGTAMNVGRYSYDRGIDPNRQMPTPGRPFDIERAIDHAGRRIENENQLLLRLIDRFRPARIASIHAIRDMHFGGIYADPRTDPEGVALGYETDSSLAVDMASYVQVSGGNVAGNRLGTIPNALYYKDPAPARRGERQARNMTGSVLDAGRGAGVSMGTWGTTAIEDPNDPARSRPAMRVITLEFPGAHRPKDLTDPLRAAQCLWQVRAFSFSLYYIFLGEYYAGER